MKNKVMEELKNWDVNLNNIVETAMELYIGKDENREKLEKTMIKYLEDMNIQALLESAILLEKNFRVKGDPVNLVADELIGINIAEYIGGKLALFNFFYYDTKKPGILARLPPFLDDAIGGFIAGCMTKVFYDAK